MAQIEHIIASDKIQRGTTQSITELHITGGIRAVERPGRLWSWHPVLVDKSIPQLAPLSIIVSPSLPMMSDWRFSEEINKAD